MINVPSGAVSQTVVRKVTETKTKVKTKTKTATETKTRRLDFDKAARQTVLTKKRKTATSSNATTANCTGPYMEWVFCLISVLAFG